MAGTEPHSIGMEKSSLPNLTPMAFAAMGEKRMEEFAKAQAVIFSTLQETHRRWLDRMQSEAKRASQFTERVTNARSIPDAVAACREWTSQRFEMMADESNRLLAESRKVVETSARFLSDGSFVTIGQEALAEAGERMRARDQNSRSSAVSSQPAASRHSGRFEESRPGGDTAPL
jgi:HSP90 family molecular chaperone